LISEDCLQLWRTSGSDPCEDLAREEQMLELASEGACILSFFEWFRPALILGYGQSERSGFDKRYCGEHSIEMLRRCSGGTGVFVDGDSVISLAMPSTKPASRSINETYDLFVDATADALKRTGIQTERWTPGSYTPSARSPICFEDHFTESLLFDGRKVMGCSQARRRRAVLVHSVLLKGLNIERQSKVFGVKSSRIERALGSLAELKGRGGDDFIDNMAQVFAGRLDLYGVRAVKPPQLKPSLRKRCSDPKWKIG